MRCPVKGALAAVVIALSSASLRESRAAPRPDPPEEDRNRPSQPGPYGWPVPFDENARRVLLEDYESGRCERIREGSSAKVVGREDGADVHRGEFCLRGNFDSKTTDPITRKRGRSRYAGLSDIPLSAVGKTLYVSYWWRLDPGNEFKAEPPSNFGGQKHAYITGSAKPWANKVNYVVGQAWGPRHWWVVNNSPNRKSKGWKADARAAEASAALGEWHRVEFYFRLESTPAQADGVAVLRIDGKVIIDRRDVPFMHGLPDQTWGKMALPSMFGGGRGPRKPFGWQMDDLEVWDGLPPPPGRGPGEPDTGKDTTEDDGP